MMVVNTGQRDAVGWTVRVLLSGVAVVVRPGEGVVHEMDDQWHVFRPLAGLETVPALGSVRFTFTVEGVLPSVEKCMIGDEPCTASA